jgi:hypothetical protein
LFTNGKRIAQSAGASNLQWCMVAVKRRPASLPARCVVDEQVTAGVLAGNEEIEAPAHDEEVIRMAILIRADAKAFAARQARASAALHRGKANAPRRDADAPKARSGGLFRSGGGGDELDEAAGF